jgi:predicted metalloprotease with PDZ domain
MRHFASSLICAFAALSVALMLPARASADSPSVSYDLAMPDPTAHVFHVGMTIEGSSRVQTVVRMPIWIPGYYSDDQYGRNVYDFDVRDDAGHRLAWKPDGQSAYVIDSQGAGAMHITYELYADRRADTGTQLSTERALFNGPQTFLYLQNDDGYPAPGSVSLTVHRPAGWSIESGLLAMQTAADTYVAPSYDVLVDCPTIIAPHFQTASFNINAVPYHLVIDGAGTYDVDKLAPVAREIIASEVKMMGHAAYKEYWILFLAGAGGGMEHLNSTLLGMPAFGWEQPHDPERGGFGGGPWNYFAFVLSHEHFHSWNVKRIRPQVLGPFRYDQEVHTRRLDVAEGFTEYYTFVHGMRSGFVTPRATWPVFANDITTEETSPGRKIFSLGDLSWNTWWPSDNPYVPGSDYYDGAAVMAFMLDLKIRHDTGDAHSIDDIMRFLFHDWESKSINQFQSPGGTYADDALPSIITAATGDAQAAQLFHTWWDTTQLPDWNTYLGYAGLRLLKTMPSADAASLDADSNEIGVANAIGFRPRGRLTYGYPMLNPDEVMLTRVLPDGAAARAGLEEFDVLQSLDGLQVTNDSLPSILAMHHAGDRVEATVQRERQVLHFTVVLGHDRTPTYRIEEIANPSPAQTRLLHDYEEGVPFGK